MPFSSEYLSGLYGGALFGAGVVFALIALLSAAAKRRSGPALDTSLYSTAVGQERARRDIAQIHALISADAGDVVCDTPPAGRLVTPRRRPPRRKLSAGF
jgi:hypothetical protein